MDLLDIVQIIMAVATVLTGLFSLVRPLAVRGFTGLEPNGPRGVSEIRAVLGGGFIGLGAAPLIFVQPAAFQMLGITYLAIGGVRLVSIFLDKASVRSNWISLAVEIVFGVVLVL
jgi:hypothetical protein